MLVVMVRVMLYLGIGLCLLNLPLLSGALAVGARLPAQELFYSRKIPVYPDLYIVDVERGLSQLFMRETDPHSVAWSADGQQVAFVSTIEGPMLRIFTSGIYGGAVRRILTDDIDQFAPRWVKGDQAMLFVTADGDSARRWAMVDLGSGLMEPPPIEPIIDANTERVWSADGRRVAVIVRPQSTLVNELFIGEAECLTGMTLCEQPLRRLRPGPSVRHAITDLRWSPDSRSLAFSASSGGTENRDIYIIDTERTGAQRVTRHAAVDVGPVWSPDGQQLAFLSNRGGSLQLFVVDLDCLPHACEANLRRLTGETGSRVLYPAWSPDGRVLAFAADREGSSEIYTVTVEDGTIRRLTVDAFDNDFPMWRP